MRRLLRSARRGPRRRHAVNFSARAQAAQFSSWDFSPYGDGHSTVRVAELGDTSFYDPAALTQLGEELRRPTTRGRHTMQNADAVVLLTPDHESTALWLSEAASGGVLADPQIWRNIYELVTFTKPTVALLSPGVVSAAPALLTSLVVAKKNTLVTAAVPASPHGAAAPVPPGTAHALSRLLGGPALGRYLAMTGHALQAADASHASIVTHALDEDFSDRNILENIAVPTDGGGYDSLVEMLDIMATNSLSAGSVLHPCPGGSAGLLAKVHTSFGTATSVDELLELLQADGSRWAAACIAGIEAYPRWCSDLTFELLGAASSVSLEDCLELEHCAAANIHAARNNGIDPSALGAEALLGKPEAGGTGLELTYREQCFPFSNAEILHLDKSWTTAQKALAADPEDVLAAETGERLSSFRGALEHVRWTKVQSKLLAQLEHDMGALKAAGFELGPMGLKVEEALRSAEGRRRLQPVLELLARRGGGGLLLDEDALNHSRSTQSVGDAYALNAAYREARYQEEREEYESWGGGSRRQQSRRGRGGRGGRSIKLDTLSMDVSFDLLEGEYIAEWAAKVGALAEELADGASGSVAKPAPGSDHSVWRERQAVLARIARP